MDGSKVLFISHAEKDKELISHFVELLYQLGLNEKTMFCSSFEQLGVPIRENIYDYLRNLLDSESVIPVFMLSDAYYRSPACLNEMGAVWVKQTDYFTFLMPGFEFKKIKGAIDVNKRAIQLGGNLKELKSGLTSFKKEICKIFGVSIEDTRWELCRDSFIEKLQNSIVAARKSIIAMSNVEGFCINHVNYGACDISVDESANKVTAKIDFSQTEAELCSTVFYLGGIDFSWQIASYPRLQFSIRADGDIRNVSVETHLNDMNPSQLMVVSDQWMDYDLPLQSFCSLEKPWTSFKEVCFVVNRRNMSKGIIEIRDIRIV